MNHTVITKAAISTVSSIIAISLVTPVFAATTPSLTKGQFLEMFLRSVNVKPDNSGKSAYRDASSGSKYWGYIHKALELHLVKADSKTKFGVTDSVSSSYASQLAVNYYHMSLGKETPAQWAHSQGLTNGLSNIFSSKNGTVFLSRLKALSASVGSLPNSWTLLPKDASELRLAFKKMDDTQNGQTQSTMYDSIYFNLSSAGKRDTAIAQSCEKVDGVPLDSFQTKDEQGVINNTNASVVTTTMTDHGIFDQNGSPQTQTSTDVAFGNTLYEDTGDGSGWTSYSDSNAILDSEQFVPVFGISEFQDISVKHLGSTDVFTAKLTQTTNSLFYGPFLAGMASSFSSGNGGANSSLINRLTKGINTTVTIDVINTNQDPTVTEEDMNTTITIPEASFDQMSGGTMGSRFNKDVSSVLVRMLSKGQITYNNVAPSLPSGLTVPGWTS